MMGSKGIVGRGAVGEFCSGRGCWRRVGLIAEILGEKGEGLG